MPPTQTDFGNQMLVKFLDDTFVTDLLTTQLGLTPLFNLTYEPDDLDVKDLAIAELDGRQFERPAFETIRTTGQVERIMPSTERTQLHRAQPRLGRLAWVEVFLKVRLAAKVHSLASPIDHTTVKRLIEELGGVLSIADLRAKLAARYPQSVVDALFEQLRITSIEDFERRANLFVEFVYKPPPPFNPAVPERRIYPLNICVMLHADLKVADALQGAKLCRSILENEKDFPEQFAGGDIRAPYAFVVLFPDSVAVDNAIAGLTAAQVKDKVKALFTTETMIAHFVTGS
jgi:hypothetical protein